MIATNLILVPYPDLSEYIEFTVSERLIEKITQCTERSNGQTDKLHVLVLTSNDRTSYKKHFITQEIMKEILSCDISDAWCEKWAHDTVTQNIPIKLKSSKPCGKRIKKISEKKIRVYNIHIKQNVIITITNSSFKLGNAVVNCKRSYQNKTDTIQFIIENKTSASRRKEL